MKNCSTAHARRVLAGDLETVRRMIVAELGLNGHAAPSGRVRPGFGQALADWQNIARRSRDIVRYAVGNSGKLVRPALLFLSGRICGRLRPQHYRLAAAVELVHGASLAHDDVLDRSERRRHKPTVNARWGNELAVLSGDILFANAFRISADPGHDGASAILARASCMTCLGETEQTFCEKGHLLSEKAYLKIVEMKTASVFSAACELGAGLALGRGHANGHGLRADEARLVRRLVRFGREFGIAYQLADDLVDLLGTERRAGKTLGRDLAGGKLTLPLIRLLNIVKSAGERRLLLRSVRSGLHANVRRPVARLAREYGIVPDTVRLVREHIARAKACLAGLRPSVWLQMLTAVADNVIGTAEEL